MGRRHLKDEERDGIVESYRDGREKISVISIMFNVNQRTVRRVLRERGEPARQWRNRKRESTV